MSHDHIRINGCYRCVLPEGELQVTDMAATLRKLALELQTERDMRIDTDHACDALRAENERLRAENALLLEAIDSSLPR